MNRLIILIALLLPTMGDAKVIKIGMIENEITADIICDIIKDGDVVIVDSPGGYVNTAMRLSHCIHNKDVIVQVERAVSASFFAVLAGNKVCFNNKAIFGLHSYYSADLHDINKKSEYTIEQFRVVYRQTGGQIKFWNYTNMEIYAVLGIIMLTPPEHLAFVPPSDIIKLLGSRYIGECK